MPPVPGSYNWTQVAMDDEDDFADRMSREALILVCGIPEELWDEVEFPEDFDFRGCLDDDTAEAIAEIEDETGLTLKFRDTAVGRGASGIGAAVEVAGAIADVGGAAAAAYGTIRLVKKAYHKIAGRTGHRPMISLGAAECLAMADLIDRAGSVLGLVDSGDVCSHSSDRDFTGGDAFFVVLATEFGTAPLPRLRLR